MRSVASPDADVTAEKLAPLFKVVTCKVADTHRLKEGRPSAVEDKFPNTRPARTTLVGLAMNEGPCRPRHRAQTALPRRRDNGPTPAPSRRVPPSRSAP